MINEYYLIFKRLTQHLTFKFWLTVRITLLSKLMNNKVAKWFCSKFAIDSKDLSSTTVFDSASRSAAVNKYSDIIFFSNLRFLITNALRL